jgi:hypothetical protein
MYFVSTAMVDNSTSLTASEEAGSTFGVENIRDPLGSKRWRSTGLTPHIYGQLPASAAIDFWGSFYTNARSGDQARLRVADTQANLTAAPALDTGLVDVWPSGSDLSDWFGTGQPGYVHQRAIVASPVAGLWFRVDYDYTGNPDGYVEVGALPLGVRFTPERAHEWEWKYRPAPRGNYSVEYAGGGEGRGGGAFKRDTAFRFPGMVESDAFGGFDALLRERRSVKPVAVVLDETNVTNPMHYMYYGYLDVAEMPQYYTTAGRMSVVECSITEP